MELVYVAGVHRSGTSAVAGILKTLGVYMGDEFPAPNSNNPSGFWEDICLKDGFYDVLHTISSNKSNKEIDESFQRLESLIEKRTNSNIISGIKEPITSVYFDVFEHILVKHNAKIILCKRDPKDILNSQLRSLHKIQFKELDRMYQATKRRVDGLNKCVESCGLQTITVDHDETLKNPHITVNKICDFLNLEFKQEAVDFIRKS